MIGTKRESLDKRISKKKYTVGSAIGYKTQGDEVTKKLAYVVFVNKKVNRSKLDKKELVPKQVTVENRKLVTDVVVVGKRTTNKKFSKKGTFGVASFDSNTYGTVTGFASNATNRYVLTCAHCLGGRDKDPATPTKVRIKVPGKNWSAVGTQIVFSTGPGVRTDYWRYGYLDAGAVQIDEFDYSGNTNPRQIIKAPLNAKQAALWLGKPVVAQSAFSASIVGNITHLYFRNFRTHLDADVLVSNADDLAQTKQGDSGNLWCTPSGDAVCVHFAGMGLVNNRARFSLCSFAQRCVGFFGGQLHS